MKSIEERAIKIEDEIIHLNPQPIYWKAIRMAAIKSATEQKEIDDTLMVEERQKAFKIGYDIAVEEACEWLKTNNGKRFNGFEIVYTQGFIAEFRKAMEE